MLSKAGEQHHSGRGFAVFVTKVRNPLADGNHEGGRRQSSVFKWAAIYDESFEGATFRPRPFL